MRNALVRLIGWPATLIHGDTLVLDRWRWLQRRLPPVAPVSASLLDVGCGSGAFTLGAARRGYYAVGLGWDEPNQSVARDRAKLLRLNQVDFPVCDVRRLDEMAEFHGRFDTALCLENIEHILDDRKLIKDICASLKPGGRLLLTTPNYYYLPMTPGDLGPFRQIEDGAHVRRGYSPAMLKELCDHAGLQVEEIGYVSYYFSQWSTKIMRVVGFLMGTHVAWLLTLPLRALPLLLDGWLGRWLGHLLGRPPYCITLVAYKPRFEAGTPAKEMEIPRADQDRSKACH